MKDPGGKEAFCVLLWRANGGRLDSNNLPVIEHSGYVRGNCTKVIDCVECKLMQAELSHLAPLRDYAWVCVECFSSLMGAAKKRGIQVLAPGYYSEGDCQNPGCWMTPIEGHPRHSLFLNLFIGPLSDLQE